MRTSDPLSHKLHGAANDALPPLRPARHIAAVAYGDETLLLDVVAGHYYSMNAVAGRIWSLLCEGATIDEIVSDLVAEYQVDEARARQDVLGLLKQWTSVSLVVRADGGES